MTSYAVFRNLLVRYTSYFCEHITFYVNDQTCIVLFLFVHVFCFAFVWFSELIAIKIEN